MSDIPTMTVPDFVPVLSTGKHYQPEKGACFMEWASILAGEPFSDRPYCTAAYLATLCMVTNDITGDEQRHKLAPLVPSVVGTSIAMRSPAGVDYGLVDVFATRNAAHLTIEALVRKIWTEMRMQGLDREIPTQLSTLLDYGVLLPALHFTGQYGAHLDTEEISVEIEAFRRLPFEVTRQEVSALMLELAVIVNSADAAFRRMLGTLPPEQDEDSWDVVTSGVLEASAYRRIDEPLVNWLRSRGIMTALYTNLLAQVLVTITNLLLATDGSDGSEHSSRATAQCARLWYQLTDGQRPDEIIREAITAHRKAANLPEQDDSMAWVDSVPTKVRQKVGAHGC